MGAPSQRVSLELLAGHRARLCAHLPQHALLEDQRPRCGAIAMSVSEDDVEWERWRPADRLEEPASMSDIDRALQLDSVAPQWTPGAASGRESGAPAQRLQPLREAELAELESQPESESELPLSDLERSLLQRSLDSLDYLGDWSDPSNARDSIVLSCVAPEVIQGVSGPEFSCAFSDFTAERHRLHSYIIQRMLTSTRTAWVGEERRQREGTKDDEQQQQQRQQQQQQARTKPSAVLQGGPSAMRIPASDEPQVFFVVGVPGSGKDTVLKRYIRALGLSLVDASADLVKEYLAAWGKDELSLEVRENNREHGPGKHLLHAQYLHRESILICDQIVERCIEQRKSLILEKTLFNLEPVLELARGFRRRGVRVHLFGTHIQPAANWRFLTTRMSSGQAFGRYITKEQTITGLRRYQENLERLLDDQALSDVFDSIHVYDVMENEWCVSLNNERDGAPPLMGVEQRSERAA